MWLTSTIADASAAKTSRNLCRRSLGAGRLVHLLFILALRHWCGAFWVPAVVGVVLSAHWLPLLCLIIQHWWNTASPLRLRRRFLHVKQNKIPGGNSRTSAEGISYNEQNELCIICRLLPQSAKLSPAKQSFSYIKSFHIPLTHLFLVTSCAFSDVSFRCGGRSKLSLTSNKKPCSTAAARKPRDAEAILFYVISSNEYLISTLSEYTIPYV